MGIVHFLLDIYFAAVLGIAGLAKLDDPHFFISVLHHQHIFPKWSISILGKIFPWIEVTFPIILLVTIDIYKSIAIAFLLLIFIGFFIFNLMLYRTKRSASNCGCFGKYIRRRGVNTGIATSLIQLLLAMSLVALSLWTPALMWGYYLVCSVLYIVGISWIAWRTWQRHRRFATEDRSTAVPIPSPEKTTEFVSSR